MADAEGQALEERFKAALWYNIGKMVDSETIQDGTNATPQFIGALTEMVWTQIENAAQDLESFARHAGRKKITVDDVMLLSRRNEGLEVVLRAYLDNLNAESAAAKTDSGKKSKKKT